MKKKSAIGVLIVILGGAAAMRMWQARPKEQPAAEVKSKVPQGPAPALPPGFPPAFGGASLEGSKTDAVEGGWQRIFRYTAKAKAADIIAFYRKELRDAGYDLMAEGAGTYGAMLRAQDKSGKRALSVDIDAPEDQPKQTPAIKIVIFDTP